MSQEIINQIEYDIGKGMNCNLKTGRLLFQTEVLNIFRNNYNLNLNLIYNSKCDFDANISFNMGQYFKLDICEYIKKVDSSIYYIDKFDRCHLAEHYFSAYNEVYYRFDDCSRLTLITYTNNSNKIIIKDDNENTLEFTKLSTQSSNTLYYVLIKKTIKFNNNSTITYNYTYNNNRLMNVYCSTDSNRKIYFKYNEQGYIYHIYIKYNNKIHGVKFKYNSNFKIVAISTIKNSIEELKYVLSYNNGKVKNILNYKKQLAYTFTYNSSYKLTSARYGSTVFEIEGNNDIYASETLYVKDQIIYNYPRDNHESYDISNIQIEAVGGYNFEYDGNGDYTIVVKVDTLNPSNNIKMIYYYDEDGIEMSHFEVLYNNINTLKNIDITQGVELLDNGASGTKINGKNAHIGICENSYTDVGSIELNAFISYHNANISRFKESTIIYDLSFLAALNFTDGKKYINLYVGYDDTTFDIIPIALFLKQSGKLQLLTSSIELQKKEIVSIKYSVRSDVSNNQYMLSNMYLRLGERNALQFESVYADYIYTLNDQVEIKLLKLGDNHYTYYTIEDDYYMSANDLIMNFNNWAKSHNDFVFYMKDGELIERVSEAYITCHQYSHNVDEVFPFDGTFSILIKQNDYNSNLINKTNISFCGTATINYITITNVLHYYTSVSNGQITNYQDKYYNTREKIVLERDEYGIIKHYLYDDYNRLVTTNIYDDTTLVKTINHTYNYLGDIEEDGFNYTREMYTEEGLLEKIGEKSVNDSNYLDKFLIYDEKNRLLTYSDKYDSSNHVNHIRYNNKDEVIEEYVKDNSNIVNHFYEYDNYNRITNYYRLNRLNRNTSDSPKVSFSYQDSINSKIENVYLNNYNTEVTKHIYDKYGHLIEIRDVNNASKVVFQYSTITELLSFIRDNYKNTIINYYYDLSNNVNKIIEKDLNNNELLRLEKEDYDNYKELKYTFDNTEIHYKYYYETNYLINPRLHILENNYYTKSNDYDNMSRVISNHISISDNGNNTNYQLNNSNVYLEQNSSVTNLKEYVSFTTYQYLNNAEHYNFGYVYGNKCNNISSYVLEKKLNNTFINKFEYAYNFNDSKELTQDKLFRYNSSDSIISYKENNYTYDKLGNITSVNKKEGTSPNNITSNITNNYIYNNSLLTRIDNNYDNSYKTYEYDNYGNIITIRHYDSNSNLLKEEQFTYIRKSLIETYKVYNQYNELILSYKYYYNYNNVRYKKENMINHTITTFNVLNSKIISDSRSIIYLYDENDSLLGFNYSNKTYFYIKDETGNIVSIISDGKEVVRYIYDGYGNISVYEVNSNNELVINNNSSFIGNINPYRYKTYYFDTESKLYYLNSRYYSGDICRFISPDDISYIDSNIINGLNLYCYCLNNPIIYSDPDGNGILAAIIIGALVGILSSYIPDVRAKIKEDGFQWSDFFTFSTENILKYLLNAGFGALTGMLSASGLPLYIVSPLTGAVNTFSAYITGTISTYQEVIGLFLFSTALAYLALGTQKMANMYKDPVQQVGLNNVLNKIVYYVEKSIYYVGKRSEIISSLTIYTLINMRNEYD